MIIALVLVPVGVLPYLACVFLFVFLVGCVLHRGDPPKDRAGQGGGAARKPEKAKSQTAQEKARGQTLDDLKSFEEQFWDFDDEDEEGIDYW